MGNVRTEFILGGMGEDRQYTSELVSELDSHDSFLDIELSPGWGRVIDLGAHAYRNSRQGHHNTPTPSATRIPAPQGHRVVLPHQFY